MSAISFPWAEYATAESQSSTSGDVFLTKVTLSNPNVAGGVYEVKWYFEIGGSASNTLTEARVMLDGSPIGQSVIARGLDIVPRSGFAYVSLDGSHTLAVQYRFAGGSGSALIQSVRVTVQLNSVAD
jgi:hypothetical protein